MNRTLTFLKRWFFILIICFVAGCAQTKKAIYLAPGFQPQEINEIYLLPAVDARIDKQIAVDIQKYVRDQGMKLLESKDYQVSITNSIGEVVQISEEDLKSNDPLYIKKLGPPEARWVMVLMLDDVSTKMTFGSTGNAEVGGFLYDKKAGTTIWRDKGIGQVGQGGCLGMFMKGMMDESAIQTAMSNLLASIPKK